MSHASLNFARVDVLEPIVLVQRQLERSALCLSDFEFLWTGMRKFLHDLPKGILTRDEKEAVRTLVLLPTHS
jgi:hypothetical protein